MYPFLFFLCMYAMQSFSADFDHSIEAFKQMEINDVDRNSKGCTKRLKEPYLHTDLVESLCYINNIDLVLFKLYVSRIKLDRSNQFGKKWFNTLAKHATASPETATRIRILLDHNCQYDKFEILRQVAARKKGVDKEEEMERLKELFIRELRLSSASDALQGLTLLPAAQISKRSHYGFQEPPLKRRKVLEE